MADDQSRRDLLQRAKNLDRKEVMDELKRNGVNNLNDLIEVRLQELQTLGEGTEERGSILVYKCFILADWE